VRRPLLVLNAGLVTSVGMSCAATCAAIRAGVTNPTPTRFIGIDGERIMAHQVPFETPWRGRQRILHLLVNAAEQCLALLDTESRDSMPVLVCVAERLRRGRQDGLDESLVADFIEMTGIGRRNSAHSGVIAEGRVGVSLALEKARQLLAEHPVDYVLIVAADSLLNGQTLEGFWDSRRLLSRTNSNGFIPGEAGGAVLVGRRSGRESVLSCEGIGFAVEQATIESEEPLRAQGLTEAVHAALREANLHMQDVDLRITDASGEQYYFKEAALALSRTMRQRRETFDIWHPADCVGEVGAAAGAILLGVALSGCRKAYLPGRTALLQVGSDGGLRSAVVIRCEGGDAQ
jgi:3-oxoacyl-[acyl-carrier-protein] synthase I